MTGKLPIEIIEKALEAAKQASYTPKEGHVTYIDGHWIIFENGEYVLFDLFEEWGNE